MWHRNLEATALVTRNSLSYLENVFALNEARRVLVNVADAASAETLSGIDIDRCIVPDIETGWFVDCHPLIRDERPAQLAYTSGTEGKAKGIVLSYSNLADAADRIISQMDLTADVREYVGVPVTYSFGAGRIRAVSAVAGQSYLPSHGFDPIELSRMLKSGEVNALSAVPTLLRILLQMPTVIGDAGKKLRWLEIGSQYMTGAEKRGIRELFPNARIVQHYGLTEASRSTFLQISDVADEVLESVGKAVGATEVDISANGRIRIRGPHVARWQIDTDKLADVCDPDGWFETSDLGHLDDGYLYYDGRADDLINTGGVKINPDLLEARIDQLLKHGGKVVVTKVPDALRGEGILVTTDATDITMDHLRTASASALKELGVSAGEALHVMVVPIIPRTATGKPLRRLLTEGFIEQNQHAKVSVVVDHPADTKTGDVLTYFKQFFHGQNIGPSDSFETMGGDSLSYIQFSLGYEERFGQLPSGWASLTVAQLESKKVTTKVGAWRQLESATLTRAFFMICIVALHYNTFIYSKSWGAAYFLFMLSGYSVMRFQWPEISRTGKVGTILGTALRVAIPTILVTVVMQAWARTLEPKPLLLISNWFDPSGYHTAYYYFAEIYIQLLLITAVILSMSGVRNALSKRPMAISLVIIAISILVSYISEQLWDTTYIYHRTPIWYYWTFGAGMLMASARDIRERLLAMVIVGVIVVAHHGLSSASVYIIGGSVLLLLWPEISVPSSVKTIVSMIAGSSMFLYLSHDQVWSLTLRVFHGPMPWLALLIAIVFGSIFAATYRWAEGHVLTFIRARRATGIDHPAKGVFEH